MWRCALCGLNASFSSVSHVSAKLMAEFRSCCCRCFVCWTANLWGWELSLNGLRQQSGLRWGSSGMALTRNSSEKETTGQKTVQIFLRWSENAMIFSKVKGNCLSYLASSWTKSIHLWTSNFIYFFNIANLWSSVSLLIIRSVNPSHFPFQSSKEKESQVSIQARRGRNAVSFRLLQIQ